MANPYFRFKQFTIHQDRCAMKVTTDGCFFGAWSATQMENEKFNMENAMDIGTGTGLVSLMIAQKNVVHIDAVEIEKEASIQAKENIEASPWKDRIHVFNEDILAFQPGKKYDVIISNPPFYENELTSAIQKKNLAHHSEQLTISQVLQSIKPHLKDGGLFFLLCPFKRNSEVEQLIQYNQLYITDSVVLSQSTSHSPFRVIVKGSNKQSSTNKSVSISIWDERQHYTQPFIDLLKDYYLYL